MKHTLPLLTALPLTPLAALHAAETPSEGEARLAWWHEAKFGMFIHWGLYSVLGGEYDGKKSRTPGEGIMMEFKIPKTEYAKYAKAFACSQFNADEWVKLAKAPTAQEAHRA